ncbi:hypothetical protein Q8W25_17775 [Shimia thalassica]|uniref:hypothetical protein n=1 Tax=Shimia thalassica TaxID=1715693 RepID=UPI0027325D77|nr:hypothetical protein [Shimia thalassica]MDP2495882.1 hypothetical protein [Shimia thalassica]
MKSSYVTAKVVFQVIELLSWVLIAGSLVLGVWLMQNEGAGPALTVGFPGAVLGVVLIAIVQMGRAQIDTAENTAQLVDLMTRQMGQRESRVEPKLTSGGEAPEMPKLRRERVKTYKGKEIVWGEQGEVTVDGKRFSGILSAEKYIRNTIEKSEES